MVISTWFNSQWESRWLFLFLNSLCFLAVESAIIFMDDDRGMEIVDAGYKGLEACL